MAPSAEEPGVLGVVDPAAREAAGRPAVGDGPALAGGEGLAEEGEVGEGLHDLDPGLGLEAVAEGVEVELGFEVVHPGLEDRLAVQADPEADGVRPGEVGQGVRGRSRGSASSGARSRSAKITIPVVGCSRICAPSRHARRRGTARGGRKPKPLEHPIRRGKNRREQRNVWWSWLAQPSPSRSCRAFWTRAARFRDCQ